MKGVILAGGTGSRLVPLTRFMNKHLLSVGKHPMIYYVADKLRQAGIQDILVVTNRISGGDFIRYLGSGRSLGVNITYKIQEEAGGISAALALAEGFIQPDEKFIVLLGDNLFEESLAGFVEQFQKQPGGAAVFLKKVDDPHRYGVPVLDNEGRIVRIDEKPANPQSSYCVTGLYMYDFTVFDRIRSLRPSKREELEITDLNNLYADEKKLFHHLLEGWWIDAGTFASLHEARLRYFANEQEENPTD